MSAKLLNPLDPRFFELSEDQKALLTLLAASSREIAQENIAEFADTALPLWAVVEAMKLRDSGAVIGTAQMHFNWNADPRTTSESVLRLVSKCL